MTSFDVLPPKHRLALALAEKARRRATNKLAYYEPYAKQRDFHDAGAGHRERLFMAGNQLGKTIAGGFEASIHATGRYPDWWKGKRFDKPTVGWASGVTGESTRDNPQRILLGRLGQHGTGAIPADSIIETTAARGLAESVDIVKVQHVSGGTSLIAFKSYEKGREKWQGETLDWVWFDEEPPEDIYTEGLTRTNTTGGMVWMTFTPLLGISSVVKRFLHEQSPDRIVVKMTIEDAEHYTPEERARIIASYPPHEREARARGIPVLGSGRIFPVSEESIAVDAFEIPKRWKHIGGMDFGWEHPFAAVKLAYDPDADVVYVTATYRQKEATPIVHAGALRAWGTWLPWAWPHDGLQHSKDSGEQLAEQYRKQGLDLTHERATFEDGTNGVEAGISEMLIRMQTGRWKVFRHLSDWFEEFRLYHRQDGKVVKLDEDLLSASRYAMMMLRYATLDQGSWGKPLDYSKYSKGIV
jgi:phage terminase large subunit-like protein